MSQSMAQAVAPNAIERPMSASLDVDHKSTFSSVAAACFHCGLPCRDAAFKIADKVFCCRGCQAVFELLSESGLADFYRLSEGAGVRVANSPGKNRYAFLDDPSVARTLVEFSDERITTITFRVPAIHCIACVWLLENLFRLKPGIGRSHVNFPRKEVSITFENRGIRLGEVAALLASLGYEPELALSDIDARPADRVPRRLWIQLGLAGFAFGNIMLFSISSYLGLDAAGGSMFRKLFGCASLVLSLPVLVYSAADYWRSAWISLRQKMLSIDVPIAAGIIALFGESCFEVLGGRGDGYFDSLTGLIFFLLCGRLFQQKTFDRLAFDRDYKSFFPLSVSRKSGGAEEQVSLSQLKTGDRLIIRNGQLIPADSLLIAGPALVDYSFVTGESEPAEKQVADYLYAGGRQMGAAIEIETVKAVSQGYLTSLWNQDAFQKGNERQIETLTNQYSRRFTRVVIGIAMGAAIFWAVRDPARSLKAFTSVLIVACPCALALAAPFTLGTAQRMLGRRHVFVRNTGVIEKLAGIDSIVFDKTGTLTAAGAGSLTFHGPELTSREQCWLRSLAQQSTHPNALRIAQSIWEATLPVRSFRESAGCGIEGCVDGNEIWMGSAAWLESRGIQILKSGHPDATSGGSVWLAINGVYRGHYGLVSALRPEVGSLAMKLSPGYQLALLSGDNERERPRFFTLFPKSATLCFNQSPLEKLAFVRNLQDSGRSVMMVGDGLNDAGALKQCDVGIAVVENINAFSPASDIIMEASMVPRLSEVLHYAQNSVGVVRLSFGISSLYNVVGISIAASGNLSPLVCAILMPLSSITVVVFACGVTSWLGRSLGKDRP